MACIFYTRAASFFTLDGYFFFSWYCLTWSLNVEKSEKGRINITHVVVFGCLASEIAKWGLNRAPAKCEFICIVFSLLWIILLSLSCFLTRNEVPSSWWPRHTLENLSNDLKKYIYQLRFFCLRFFERNNNKSWTQPYSTLNLFSELLLRL